MGKGPLLNNAYSHTVSRQSVHVIVCKVGDIMQIIHKRPRNMAGTIIWRLGL